MRGAARMPTTARPPGDGHTLKETQLRGWPLGQVPTRPRDGMSGKTSRHHAKPLDGAATRKCEEGSPNPCGDTDIPRNHRGRAQLQERRPGIFDRLIPG